jgi:hypothetical protein
VGDLDELPLGPCYALVSCLAARAAGAVVVGAAADEPGEMDRCPHQQSLHGTRFDSPFQ